MLGLGMEEPGQPGSVAPGAFHAHTSQATPGAYPGQQGFIPRCGGGELGGAQQASVLVTRRRVVGIAVGVDTTCDPAGLVWLSPLACVRHARLLTVAT